ncbi:MAG: hypothetical protein M1449_06995 [Candidatus Thermoplasmatota archaeon]|nr:hypothetical protein [Candidatus Thermoplasmatota archaeon]
MNLHHASRFAAVALISLLPVGAYSAENPAVSDGDLAAVGERIRQTGAQIREDLKEARARMADELLFGKLAHGGRVTVDIDAGELVRLEFEEAVPA